jgi:hypothetical protein
MSKLQRSNVNTAKESLSQFAERYRAFSNPKVVDYLMKSVAMTLVKDLQLKVQTSKSHPVDTGLLKESWEIPQNLKKSNGEYQVYLDNTATTAAQHFRKTGTLLGKSGRKKSRGSFGKQKTKYVKYVPGAINLYNRKLRVVTQKVQFVFSEVFRSFLMKYVQAGQLTVEQAFNLVEKLNESLVSR